MEYADGSCRLIRNFGDGQEEITLALERFSPDPVVDIGLAGSAIKAKRGAAIATVAFAPSGSKQKRSLFHSALADGHVAYMIRAASLLDTPDQSKMSQKERDEINRSPVVPEKELAAAKSVDTLAVSNGFEQPFEVQLGPMIAPMTAMQSCIDELMTHWDIDAKAHRTLTRRATPTKTDKMMEALLENWPDGPLARQLGGFVRFRLLIDRNGRPINCTITLPSGPKEYIELACQTLMRRLRFSPALDAQGQPIASFYANTIVFVP